jgi:hypothetical protein
VRDDEPFWRFIRSIEAEYLAWGDEKLFRLRMFRRGFERREIDRRVAELNREREERDEG